MNYVCGFLFYSRHDMVALIHKKKGPPPVVGRLNGIGGKVEQDEDPHYAMVREFREEAGVLVPAEQWRKFARLTMRSGPVVDFFTATASTAQFSNVRKMEEEDIMWVEWRKLHAYNVMPNLHWLVPLALDKDKVVVTIEDPT